MSRSPTKHKQDSNNLNIEEENLEANEGFKDEPPEKISYFDGSDFDLDAFAVSSLQAAASAVLSAQQQQQAHTLTSNTSQEGSFYSFGSISASQLADYNDQIDMSASSSMRRPSYSGGEGGTSSKDKASIHVERHMWTPTETKALVDGCNKHGIGNWKAILHDQTLAIYFNGRTPGDLKDRFRTYFPDAYHEAYPNAKTHTSRAIRSKAPDGKSIFEKGKTKERRPFTVAEDEVLRKGYEQFGSHWAVIAKNAVFEGRRKSTDLRDRFRNAFPSLYEQAGYKPRTKSHKKERRLSSGNGSFSHMDQSSGVQIDWQAEASQRPALQSRSETSASAHSQAVSEHSEVSEEDDSSDARDVYKGRSDSIRSSLGMPQMSQHHRQYASTPAMERSLSHSSSIVPQVSSSNVGKLSSTSSPFLQNVPPKVPAVLRRTQSSKRASLKIGSLDQAVKTAYTKSNKEAALASHHHHQNYQQQSPLPHRLPSVRDASSAGLQRPPLNQSVSVGWSHRYNWIPGTAGSSDAANAISMDLDQMDAIMSESSATQLSSGSAQVPIALDEAMNVDEVQASTNSTQADLANWYQHFALAGGVDAANRPLPIESFQDLLDPVFQLQSTGQIGDWEQTSSNVPWTPISSANATMSSGNTLQTSANSATRREYEHNQWAGDLLHRGSYSNQDQLQQLDPQGFVSMASMHLSTSDQGIPVSRSADDNLGQVSRSDSTLNRPLIAEQMNTSIERPTLRSNEHGAYSTPSVHELISRSARRQSYTPRSVGFSGDDGDEMMQSAYGNPYPYPADDIQLLNSSAGGSLTLFPSLVNNQVNEYGQAAMMRRRRSTDTLREGNYNFTQSWRGGLLDSSARQVEEQDEISKEDSLHGQRETTPTSSRHDTSEQSRSMSDTQINEDDDGDEAPSRAASVSKMGVVEQRDSVLYAESLPDLTTTIDNSAFSHHNNLQISYDDMNLPSFLNRSPSFLHAATTSATTSFSTRSAMEGGVGVSGRNSFKAWSATGANEALRGDNFVPLSSTEQRQTVSKGSSRSVDWTNMSEVSSSPFGFNPMRDAGSLDRLEHLYLEGLHAPSSPLPMNQGISGSVSANAAINLGYDGAGSTDSSSNNMTFLQRRQTASNTFNSSVDTNINTDNNTGSGATDAGYESV